MKFILLDSYEFTNIRNNSLLIVSENTSVYLDGIRLAQSKKKRKRFIKNY